MSMMDGYLEGVFMAGGFAKRRKQEVVVDHTKVIEALKEKKAWRSYAATLKASLDAERQAEADVIKALQEASPEHALANPEAVKSLQQNYFDKAKADEATVFAKADEGVKKFMKD